MWRRIALTHSIPLRQEVNDWITLTLSIPFRKDLYDSGLHELCRPPAPLPIPVSVREWITLTLSVRHTRAVTKGPNSIS